MFFIYDAQDALFAFMQRGGDVLYLIGLLAFFMWFLIFERLWYFTFIHDSLIDKAITQWESRPDKLSWNSSAIRDMLVSESKSSINQNLSLIKMCVGIAPLFGLFGTITGMIEVFHILAVTGGGDAKAMAGGVARSTIPAMAGLMAAIPASIAARWLEQNARKKSDLVSEHLTYE